MVLVHQSLQTDELSQQIEDMFVGVDPYTEVKFSNVSATGGATALQGTARTAEGCASKIEMGLVENQIVQFNITPLCR